MSPSLLLFIATCMPLLGAGLTLLAGPRAHRVAAYLATSCMVLTLGLSATALVVWLGKGGIQQAHYVEALNVPWLPLGLGHAAAPFPRHGVQRATPFYGFTAGVMVDSLTLTMFMMISLIGTLVHVFAITYMAGDPRYVRLFGLLNFFCFSMLALVLSSNLLELFVFWEMVGACSYLLVGFYVDHASAGRASSKTLIVNRIGDTGFLLGMGLLLVHCGPAAFTFYNRFGRPVMARAVMAAVHGAGPLAVLHGHGVAAVSGMGWLSWCGLCFFFAAMAKSAQFPLHTWLPDAMEGPTPVSALIHAATMVAAGVYLVARLYPILTLDVRLIIAIVGCVTLAMGAMLALVATQIKRVLAYSTISQLGYMMLFLGCGGYVAGLFQLITHAFFKSTLFLAAGSVIHGVNHEHDIRRMGGLWRRMPITAGAFLVGALAITATPWFSGYYSKELGMAAVGGYSFALGGDGKLLFYVSAAATFLTAFYMWRCWWLVFGGKPRDQDLYDRASEAPMMTLPLILLGVMAVVAGHPFLEAQKLLAASAPAVVRQMPARVAANVSALRVTAWVHFAFIFGALAAVLLYLRGLGTADRMRRFPGVNLIYVWLKNGMFFDDLFDGAVSAPVRLTAYIAGLFDRFVLNGAIAGAAAGVRKTATAAGAIDRIAVDGTVDALAAAAGHVGQTLRGAQTGRVRLYLLSMVSAVALVAVVLAIFLALH